MKMPQRTLALSFAALFAFSTSAIAMPNYVWKVSGGDPAFDDSGFDTFGYNIAFAGNTPASVRNFVAGLSPTEQRSAYVGCNSALNDASMARNSTVMMFCRNLGAS